MVLGALCWELGSRTKRYLYLIISQYLIWFYSVWGSKWAHGFPQNYCVLFDFSVHTLANRSPSFKLVAFSITQTLKKQKVSALQQQNIQANFLFPCLKTWTYYSQRNLGSFQQRIILKIKVEVLGVPIKLFHTSKRSGQGDITAKSCEWQRLKR